jgi:hypothetical protein
MTGKGDFTAEEWELVREGPPTAGIMVAFASGGGTFRESWALAKTFTEARQKHGESELLDAIVGERPHIDRYHSREEAESEGLRQLGEAVGLLQQKATPDELESYKQFTLDVAQRVAGAHKEQDAEVSPEESQAIEKIRSTLGSSG